MLENSQRYSRSFINGFKADGVEKEVGGKSRKGEKWKKGTVHTVAYKCANQIYL